jgi:hypothetical protein
MEHFQAAGLGPAAVGDPVTGERLARRGDGTAGRHRAGDVRPADHGLPRGIRARIDDETSSSSPTIQKLTSPVSGEKRSIRVVISAPLSSCAGPADLLTTAAPERAGREADDGVRDHVIGRL